MTTVIAAFVAVISAVIATIACVLAARFFSLSSKLVSQLRSTVSLQGELIEIRDYMGKLDAWAKRINAREVMGQRRAQARAESEDSPNGSAPSRGATGRGESRKDQLRRRAGLIAGKVPAHQSDMEIDDQ